MGRSFSIIKRQAIKFRLESGEDATGVSSRQLRKMRHNWEHFSEVAKPQLATGQRKKMNQQQIDQLLVYLDQRPTSYLDEMCWFLYDEFDVLVRESTVSRTLKQMAWNRKIAIRIAQQRNESLRGKGRRDERSRIRAFKTGDDDLGGLILNICLNEGAEFLGNSVVDARFHDCLEGCLGGCFEGCLGGCFRGMMAGITTLKVHINDNQKDIINRTIL